MAVNQGYQDTQLERNYSGNNISSTLLLLNLLEELPDDASLVFFLWKYLGEIDIKSMNLYRWEQRLQAFSRVSVGSFGSSSGRKLLGNL